eukprot:TRINITY_DN7786_c1_g1_i1.p1 TRINITY_DN7786_c1_g1~~TRINITY_DN7786_c1_g1_i1.p1  ORF type:complete len:381 (+),score=54.92 TRINITY_DN7786_c1_g1_i1:114-1145(+)
MTLDTTEVIGRLLDAVAEANKDVLPLTDDADPRSDFECVDIPNQKFSVFMRRMRRFRHADRLWLQALVLVHRLQFIARMSVTPYTVHRLMLTGFLLAAKLSYDANDVNVFVATRGGVALADLNCMEQSFLKLSQWHVIVWPEEGEVVTSSMAVLEAYAIACHNTGFAAAVFPAHVAQQLSLARNRLMHRTPVRSSPSTATARSVSCSPSGMRSPHAVAGSGPLHPRPPCGAQSVPSRAQVSVAADQQQQQQQRVRAGVAPQPPASLDTQQQHPPGVRAHAHDGPQARESTHRPRPPPQQRSSSIRRGREFIRCVALALADRGPPKAAVSDCPSPASTAPDSLE